MVITMSNKKIEIKNCTSFKDRLLGFMFQKNIKNALCFPHCNSIHTFFMKVPILVIMTDKNHTILYQNVVKPWNLISVKKAYYTYEFPYTYLVNTKIGDTFKG